MDFPFTGIRMKDSKNGHVSLKLRLYIRVPQLTDKESTMIELSDQEIRRGYL